MQENRDIRHITNECPAYQYERQILVEELIAHEVEENIDLYDIVLCTKKFEENAKWPNQKAQQVEEPSKTLLTGFTEEETVKNSKGPQQSHCILKKAQG